MERSKSQVKRLSVQMTGSLPPVMEWEDANRFSGFGYYGAPLDVQTLKKMLEGSLRVNSRDADRKQTPLHMAAESCLGDIVRYLIEQGADVNAVDYRNNTPLHFAVLLTRDPAVIKILLEAGADVRARNDVGSTPWDIVVLNETILSSKVVLDLFKAYYAYDEYATFNSVLKMQALKSNAQETYVSNIRELYEFIDNSSKLGPDDLVSVNGGEVWYKVGTFDRHINDDSQLTYVIPESDLSFEPKVQLLSIAL